MSPLGGPARRLSDFPARAQLSWSPDGRWLAASKARSGSDPPGGIHLIPVASGEPRAVTFPKPPAFDVSPAFSPDGRALAYASCEGPEASPVCDVYVLPLDSELRPQGAARRLTRQRLSDRGVAWTRDGRSIVYSAGATASGASARTAALLPSAWSWPAAAQLPRPPRAAGTVSLSSGGPGRRHLPSPAGRLSDPAHRVDVRGLHPQYSPDGRRIAFESDRAGDAEEIWLADADGSNPTRLTRGPGRCQGSPRWSPDGRSIAFDSQAENGHVGHLDDRRRRLGAAPGHARPRGRHPAELVARRPLHLLHLQPDGPPEVWRVAGRGRDGRAGDARGRRPPFESVDGRTLYYQRSAGRARSSRSPTAGGEERTIRSVRHALGYAVAPRGIFHVDCGTPGAAVPRDASCATGTRRRGRTGRSRRSRPT